MSEQDLLSREQKLGILQELRSGELSDDQATTLLQKVIDD